ncbi:hypothetical protein ABKN59_002987 [Abortiporus biennis]
MLQTIGGRPRTVAFTNLYLTKYLTHPPGIHITIACIISGIFNFLRGNRENPIGDLHDSIVHFLEEISM